MNKFQYRSNQFEDFELVYDNRLTYCRYNFINRIQPDGIAIAFQQRLSNGHYEYNDAYRHIYDAEKYRETAALIFAKRVFPFFEWLKTVNIEVIDVAEIGYGNLDFANYLCAEFSKAFPRRKLIYHGYDLGDENQRRNKPLQRIITDNASQILYGTLTELKSVGEQTTFDWAFAFDVLEHMNYWENIDTGQILPAVDSELQPIDSIDILPGKLIMRFFAPAIKDLRTRHFQITFPVVNEFIQATQYAQFLSQWRHFKPFEHTIYANRHGVEQMMLLAGFRKEYSSFDRPEISECGPRPAQVNIQQLVYDITNVNDGLAKEHIYSAVYEKPGIGKQPATGL